MAYPARPRQSARIVTTNVEESAEAEVADRVTVKAKGRIVHCLTRQSVYLEMQQSDVRRGTLFSRRQGVSRQQRRSDDVQYAESKRDKISTKPPYAERHVRWCGRKENESRSENLLRFPTYPIFMGLFPQKTIDFAIETMTLLIQIDGYKSQTYIYPTHSVLQSLLESDFQSL